MGACAPLSMDKFIERYGGKVNKALDFLRKKFSYKVRIFRPLKNDSIYGDEDNDMEWDEVAHFDGQYIVTGLMNNVSPSKEILDPFYEEDRFIYFTDGEEPIKDSLVEVVGAFGGIFRFRLGAEETATGLMYRKFLLYPVA